MRFSDEFLLRVKESNDIYDVMSSYLPLKKAGADYVCVCPFHPDKNPSCHVYMATQSFHCFGCKASGDVINFIRLYEHLDYRDAIVFLADRAGIPLPDDGGGEDISKKRVRILEMNREAGRFYHKLLLSPNGKPGLDYLYGRGLTLHTIRTYGLGYAPDSWDTLKKHMNSQGYSDEEMEAASLLSKSSRSKNYFDFFKSRVMFPFIDDNGNIVGFSGRIIGGDDPRKYLNTKSTLVYDKSRFLYSMNHAKNAAQKELILCEGNLDVISLYQAGFKNAVATCGTALTSSHASAIAKKGFKNVILAYDGDAAGQNATIKAINVLDGMGLGAKVLKIYGAKDPDEFIKSFGRDAFATLVNESHSAVSFGLEHLKAGTDMNTLEGKSDYLQKSVKYLAGIQNIATRAVYASAVAKECDVDKRTVEAAIERAMKSQTRQREKQQRQEVISGGKRDFVNPQAAQFPAEAKAERAIIAFLFHSPDCLPKVTAQISADDFPTEFNRNLFIVLNAAISCGSQVDLSSLGEMYSPQEISSISSMIHENNELSYTAERLSECISVLKRHSDKQKSKAAAEMSDDELLSYAEKIRSQKKK